MPVPVSGVSGGARCCHRCLLFSNDSNPPSTFFQQPTCHRLEPRPARNGTGRPEKCRTIQQASVEECPAKGNIPLFWPCPSGFLSIGPCQKVWPEKARGLVRPENSTGSRRKGPLPPFFSWRPGTGFPVEKTGSGPRRCWQSKRVFCFPPTFRSLHSGGAIKK